MGILPTHVGAMLVRDVRRVISTDDATQPQLNLVVSNTRGVFLPGGGEFV